jgi:outer membrane lipoprotein-sorting protein
MVKRVLMLIVVGLSFSPALGQGENLRLEEIVSRHIAAMGGREKLKSVGSMRFEGIYTYRGWEYPFVLTRARPNLLHLEITNEGKKRVVAFDGETVWEMDEMRPTAPRPIRDLRDKTFVEAMSDLEGSVVDYQAKGHQVALVGQQNAEGQSAYHLKATLKGGGIEELFIESSSFLLLKRFVKVGSGDRVFEQALYFMDYKEVDGVMMPHYIERLDGHRVKSYEISAAEIDPQVDLRIFKMPN